MGRRPDEAEPLLTEAVAHLHLDLGRPDRAESLFREARGSTGRPTLVPTPTRTPCGRPSTWACCSPIAGGSARPNPYCGRRPASNPPRTDTPLMCGRYTFTMTAAELAEWYGVDPPADHAPRYNVAPSQLVAVVGRKAGTARRGLVRMRWGFVPRWAADPDAGPKPINAKAETVFTSPAFRLSARDRRCLLPADGFYEWAEVGGKKRAIHFRPAAVPVAFAGVWDVWRPAGGGDPLYTCAVVTVPANDAVRPFHHRMPAVLPAAAFAPWLDPAATPGLLAALLRPYPLALSAAPVGPAVNSPRSDGPECLTPAA